MPEDEKFFKFNSALYEMFACIFFIKKKVSQIWGIKIKVVMPKIVT